MTIDQPQTQQNNDKTVLEKANTLFRHIIGPETPVKLRTKSPDCSPRTLAMKRTDIELDYIEGVAQLNLDIELKETELKTILDGSGELVDSPEYQTIRDNISSELKALKDKALKYREEKLQLATQIDALVGAKQAEDMKEMDAEVAKFKRIAIIQESGKGIKTNKRNLKPVRYYSDLQALIETYHPEFKCVLSVPDTGEIVGSQFELLCAYQDSSNGILTLNLELIPTLKRTNEYVDESVGQDVFVNHSGRWLNSEIELFHSGVSHYGWGEWAKIADYIQTRDRVQVYKFSLNQRAKKFKISSSVVPVLSDLAEGLKTIARTLETTQNSDKE